MIIDSSALVSILFGEPDAARMAECVLSSDSPRIGAPNWVEVAMVIYNPEHPDLRSKLDHLIEAMKIQVVAFDQNHALQAREAFERFGRGRHRLNYGDCMAYALAKSTGGPLLFKGDDFVHTDIVPALA